MNKLGLQIEKSGPAQKMMLEQTNPWTVKILQGGKSIGDLRNWRARQPNGPLVCRYVFDGAPLDQMANRLTQSLAFFDDVKQVGGPIYMEVPYNEEHQNGIALIELAEASIPAAQRIIDAGFIPIVLITSEGNPHDMEQWKDPRLLTALRVLRNMGCVWGPHEYSAPPLDPIDGWHSGRWRKVYEILPVDCQMPIYFGECGIDGGINTGVSPQRMETGFRGYMDARGYAGWLNRLADHYAAEYHVLGAAVFLSGTYGRWSSFDIGDEVDLRECFTRIIAGPAIWQPPPGISPPGPVIIPPPPVVVPPAVVKPKPIGGTVPNISLSVPLRESPAHSKNYSEGPRAKTVGVVIHSTGGQASNPRNEYSGTINWFQAEEAQVSAHYVVGPDEVARCVDDSDVAWHARSQNAVRIGIEIAHADTEGANAAGYSAFQYEATGEIIGKLSKVYGFPIVFVTDETKPGLIFHRATVDGKKDGKRDPTGFFDAGRLLEEARKWVETKPVDAPVTTGTTVPVVVTTPVPSKKKVDLLNETWALAERWAAAGYPWVSQGLKSTVALVKGEK